MNDNWSMETRFQVVRNQLELLFLLLRNLRRGSVFRVSALLSGKLSLFSQVFLFALQERHRLVFRVVVRSNLLLNFGAALLASVLEVEADRELEVKLDRSALVRSVESVVQLDIDFRAVESAIALLDRPLLAEFIESLCERLLCLVPNLDFSQEFFRSR